MLPIPYPDERNHFLSDHIQLMTNSYQKLLGVPLIPNTAEPELAAKTIFYAPFVVLSHDNSADPLFNYANLKAMELFEFSWAELISLPSRLSAEPSHQQAREKLLSEVARFGYSSNYQGIRISKSGQRFSIKNATIWNLYDGQGGYAGQAAWFSQWRYMKN